MTEITLDEQSAKLEAYEKGFLAVYLVSTGVALGLFDKLSAFEAGIGPDALARELGLHEPYVRVWCQTACHFEILDGLADGTFTLAPHMRALLTETENPYYFGHRAGVMVSHVAEDLKRHPEFYRSGRRHAYRAHGQQFSKDVRALTSHVVPVAYKFMVVPSVPGLQERLEGGIKVLDVGCGGGFLIVQLARDFPRCKFVGVEADRFAVRDARRQIEESGVGDRASARLADAASLDYDAEFDLVNMAVVLHEILPDKRRKAMANCYRALRDSGEVAILDFAYPEKADDFRKPEYSPGIKDQFYELVLGHEHLPASARHQLLLEAGFKDPVTIPLFGGPIEVTYATK